MRRKTFRFLPYLTLCIIALSSCNTGVDSSRYNSDYVNTTIMTTQGTTELTQITTTTEESITTTTTQTTSTTRVTTPVTSTTIKSSEATTTKSPTPPRAKILVNEPRSPGKVTYDNDRILVDASNSSEGYIMIRHKGKSGRNLKVRIEKSGQTTYDYDLHGDGRYAVYPLQLGKGKYTVKVFEHVEGNRYASIFGTEINAQPKNDKTAFTYPNVQVDFDKNSAAIKKAAQLCAGMDNDLDKVRAIYMYIVENIKYDEKKAAEIDGLDYYIPDVDKVIAAGKGICYDYSTLFAAMLRSQNIPAKLVMGYALPESIYHAWNVVYIEGKGTLVAQISVKGNKWKLLDTTFAAGAGNEYAGEIMADSSNYISIYTY